MARGQKGVRVAVVAFAAAGALVFVPLWAPLVLAAWIADLVRPMVRRLERAFGGRRAAAGAFSVLVVLALGAPFVASALLLVTDLREWLTAALRAGSVREALRDVLGTGQSVEPPGLGPRAAVQLLRQHGAAISRWLGNIWSASVSVIVGAVVFVVALYAMSVGGRRLYVWLARSVPFDPAARRRFVGAFRETGRGLLVGSGGTALAQGTLATIAYAALGVHNPLILGLMTGIGSLVPAVGTAIVWLPVAVALAVAGHVVRATILAAIGFGVIGTVDNVLRPWLSRLGQLRLPTVVVFLSMIGGWRLIGGWGLMLGPLLVRMGAEALSIERDAHSRSGSELTRHHGPHSCRAPARRAEA